MGGHLRALKEVMGVAPIREETVRARAEAGISEVSAVVASRDMEAGLRDRRRGTTGLICDARAAESRGLTDGPDVGGGLGPWGERERERSPRCTSCSAGQQVGRLRWTAWNLL